MSIGIHIIGPGYGESIVLELPDNRVGVIDSYQHPHGRNNVCDFLRQRCAGKPLVFLAVTHPHADHCMGLDKLLELHPEEIWVFDALFQEHLSKYYRALAEARERDLLERDLHVKPGTVLRSILTLQEEVRRRLELRLDSTVKVLRSSRSFPLCGGRLQVKCLTPGDASCLRYESLSSDVSAAALAIILARAKVRSRLLARLRSFLTSILPRRKNLRIPTINHNLISSAIVFQHGKTRLLLMADAEKPLWEDWSQEAMAVRRLRTEGVQLFKVAHHGSANGYFEQLYSSAAPAGDSLAVLTPFERGRAPLPTSAGLSGIKTHARSIACTNRAAAEKNSQMPWSAAPPWTGAMPVSWQTAIQAEPRLAKLLAPPHGDPSGVPRDLMLPPRWAYDCMLQPELYQLLHPALPRSRGRRKRSLSLAEYDEFHVSFFFDDQGKEDRDRRYIGPGAGLVS
jgi:hypothetical protein